MLIQIFADYRGEGRCRSCDRPIVWVETRRGRKMPFDPPLITAQTQGDEPVKGRPIETVDTATCETHFKTCPSADQWRRRR